MDYKDTLSLPTTDFAMRGNLPASEPKRYAKWKEARFYEQMLSKRQNAKESFYIHDGPPYANGNLHIGHALNKILKDIIIKYHYFQGRKICYTPGWDCHGLPIEQQVEKSFKEKGIKKDTLDPIEIRRLCREYADNFVQIQSDEFQQLGVLGDFAKPYKTMDFAFEADIYGALCEVAKNGLLAERHKPIYWSWACQTALADAEVEYEEKQSDSVFVAFALDEKSQSKLQVQNAALIIWTTTPWTLPANVAIALNPTATYALTQDGYIVAKALHAKLLASGLIKGDIVQEFPASALENLHAINPLNSRQSRIILGEHVSLDDGTGAVHTAPGHGEEDYYIGLKYDLEVLMPVDDRGCYSEQIIDKKLLPDSFLGKHIFKAQKEIMELLGSALLKHEVITHSYPHCWRSKEPVIYRATTQWFILMDKPFKEGKTLRQLALEAIANTTFYPEVGRNRIQAMVEDRPDWCISRQRDWGVPIAFFRDKVSGENILDSEVLEYIKARFSKEGCDVWWSESIEDLLPPSWKHKASSLEKGMHILDVWLESGSTWQAVLKSGNYNAGDYPADMYLEGSDQHRGWFQSSLLLGCAIEGRAPFKSVLTHGFCVDQYGRKMSKSEGNVIAPKEVLDKHGGEIFRLWVAMNEYHHDLRISLGEILARTGEQYKKLRNTLRFLLANTNDLGAPCDFGAMSAIDIWILQTTHKTFTKIHEYFAKYDFVKGLQILMHYISNELSGIYMDLCKDSLYCDSKEDSRASKTAMALIAKNLAHLLAPILTYTIDEMLEFAPKVIKGEAQNVLDIAPVDLSAVMGVALPQDFDALLELRGKFGEVIDNLKKDKAIKSSLEIAIFSPDLKFDLLDKWLIVSEVLENAPQSPLASFECGGKSFVLAHAQKSKCPRCWRHLSSQEDALCGRCQEVLG